MKATAQVLSESIPVDKSWLAVYCELFKARLTSLVLLTTAVGFYIGYQGRVNYLLMLHTVLGMALVASGGAALNQLWERRYDAKMRRTQDRPLPSGRMEPQTVSFVGRSLSVAGVAYLAMAVNLTTALLGAFTLFTYLFIYTPLKRVTWLNTSIGAVPGALPPLIGWTAARGGLGYEGFSLFAIQALWQVPHFMAIAWIYRDEYAKAGFKMLPVLDPEGRRTARQAMGHSLALLLASILPFWFGLAGPVYLAGALFLGLFFIWFAAQFCRDLTIARARHLFYASILYLPLLLGVMVLDKIRH